MNDQIPEQPAPQLQLALKYVAKAREKIKTPSHEKFKECLGDLYVIIEMFV